MSAHVLPTTMRAAVQTGIRQMAIIEKPVPTPGPGEVLIRLRAVGICGSDVHYYVDGRIGDARVPFPFVLGHEPAGEIAALGAGVTGLHAGERVALEPALPCGVCPTCRSGHGNACPSVRFLGTPPHNGTFEEYHVYAAEQCVLIPEGVSFVAAATLEPAAVALHAVNLARLRLGDRVAVMGGGPIGLLTALAARLAGASFVALTEPIAARRAHAAQYGFDMVLDPTDGGAVAAIQRAAGAIDVAFECAGTQGAIDDATLAVRPAGTAVIVGIPAEDRIALWVHLLRRKELTLRMARRSYATLEPAIRLMSAGLFAPERIVTHRMSLDELPAALEMVHAYRDGVVKAMVEMGDEE